MLSAEETRRLDRLALGSSASSPSAAMSGLRFATARAFGVEFQDFRAYQPGDDLRSVDWTIDARLRQLVVRRFRAEGHVRLHLLVDVSASMSVGNPTKLACAHKVAAALCYVAVAARDEVGLALFDDTIRARLPVVSGRAQLFRVFEALGRNTPAGRSSIGRALIDYATAVRGTGLAVVISDFYDPGGGLDALRFLRFRGLTPAVVHVVADEELQPDVGDLVELVDVEDPGAPPIAVDPSDLEAYRRRMTALSVGLQDFAAGNGLPWLRVPSSVPFDALLDGCMRAGLLSIRG